LDRLPGAGSWVKALALDVVVYVETIDARRNSSFSDIQSFDLDVKEISLLSAISRHWIEGRELDRLDALGVADLLLVDDRLRKRGLL
jgi:hypothetical protein